VVVYINFIDDFSCVIVERIVGMIDDGVMF